MESMLNGTMNTAKDAIDSAREGVEHALGSVKHGTERAVSSTRSSLLDAVHAANELFAMLRGLDRDAALGWVGLERRRGPLSSAAIFGAGVVVGTGVGVLLAPMSGTDLRHALVARLTGLKREVKGSIEQAASSAEKKVEAVTEKTGDAMKKAEQKVESKVTAGIEAVKKAEQKVENKVTAGAEAVKKAEQKVENKVIAGAEAVKDAVLQKADAAAGALRQPADDTRPASPGAKNHGTGGPTHSPHS